MKLKLPDNLLIVDILTVFLILAILLIPESGLRVVLGLPFLLFFPGFVLVEALFIRRKRDISSLNPSLPPETHDSQPMTHNSSGLDVIERIALSFGMSIACTALIGLGLNYTPWGIRLLPVLYSISAFILILSAVALFRQYSLNHRIDWLCSYTLKMPGWEGSALNKALSVILAVAILGAVGTLIFTVAHPKVGEKFTEFYILGYNGKAADYPSQFTWDAAGQKPVSVRYGDNDTAVDVNESFAQVTLGIINQEQENTTYTVEIQIDNQTVPIHYDNSTLPALTGIQLVQGQKWEQPVGFSPQHIGNNQKVEFFLYKDDAAEAEETLHLWVSVQ